MTKTTTTPPPTSDVLTPPAALELRPLDIPQTGITSIEFAQQMRAAIGELIGKVFRPDVHFGVIPGCGNKPALFQPGAQAIGWLFNVTAVPEGKVTDLPGGHRLWEGEARLAHRVSGQVLAVGMGLCSTMEEKYRYRKSERVCPECKKPNIRRSKNEEGGYYCWERTGGCGAQFKEGDREIESQQLGKVEHGNPFDFYNTCAKIWFKRAFVHASINLSGCSDLFTQDIEDSPEQFGGHEPPAKAAETKPAANPTKAPAAKPTPAPATAGEQPKAKPAASQYKKLDGDGEGEANVVSVEVLRESPKNIRDPWVLWRVVLERGGKQVELTTLSKAAADNAKLAMAHKKRAFCKWVLKDGKHQNLTECKPIGVPEPKPERRSKSIAETVGTKSKPTFPPGPITEEEVDAALNSD